MRRRQPVIAWLLPACLLAGQGCTGEERFALPALEGGAPDTRYESACAAWAQSACAHAQLCYRTGSGTHFAWDSVDQCIARETLGCELLAADPNVSFDENRVRGCVYPSDCTSELPVCWSRGGTLAGRPCLWDEACHSGVCFGGGTSQGVCGVCICASGCLAGQTCLIDSAGGSTCVPPPRLPGQPCASSTECESGLCVPAGGQQVCSPFAQLGEACGTGMPSCGNLPTTDAFCDETGHCNKLSLVGYGATCGAPTDGGAWTFCSGWATCFGGSCLPPAKDGEPCDPNQGIDCVWPAECIANHCIFPTLADCSL